MQFDADENLISDITPLASLTKLTRLDLGRNQISDITTLAGLTNLTYLDLDENLISDITPLAGLIGLVSLDLVHNRILDASPLAGLTNLTESLGDENIQGLIDGQRVPLGNVAVGTPYKIPVVTQVDGSIVPVEVGSDGGTALRWIRDLECGCWGQWSADLVQRHHHQRHGHKVHRTDGPEYSPNRRATGPS